MTEVEKAAQFHWSATPYIGKETDAVIEAFIAGAAWAREQDAAYIERRTREDLKIADPTGSTGVMAEDYFSWRLASEIRAQAEKAGEE